MDSFLWSLAALVAGISKIQSSGWQWGKAEHMSLMLAERGFGRLGPLRLYLAQSRLACTVVGATGLGIELGGPLFLWAPAHPALAVVLVIFKLLTWILFGYFEPEWALVAVAIGLSY